MKKVYVAMSADLIHPGHINLINEAMKYGDITIGLLTDKAIASYKRLPYMDYSQRKIVLMNIKGISKVIPQNEWDYSINLKKIKPNYMLHGSDWTSGPQLSLRKNALKTLKKFKGKLVEIPYTRGVSSTALSMQEDKKFTTPELRVKNLKRLLKTKSLLRIIETHSPISALIAENSILKKKKN